jgi:hypothetical protein
MGKIAGFFFLFRVVLNKVSDLSYNILVEEGGRAMKIVVLFCVIGLVTCAVSAALSQDDGGMSDEEFREWLVQLIESIAAQESSEGPIIDPDCNPAVVDIYLRKLNLQQVTFAFQETDFNQCIDFLRDITGLNIVLSRKAQEAVKDLKVTLRLRDIVLKNAFALVLGVSADLRYGIRFDVLYIGMKDEFVFRGNYLIIYEIGEIVYRPPDFEAPELALPSDASSQRR